MSIQVQAQPCVLLTCDDCKETLNSGDTVIHFDGEADARRSIEDWDWSIDAAGRIRCMECAAQQEERTNG